MSATAIIAAISAAAPLIEQLGKSAAEWLDLYKKDPTNPELLAMWTVMVAQRQEAVQSYNDAVDKWYADHPDIPRHDAT